MFALFEAHGQETDFGHETDHSFNSKANINELKQEKFSDIKQVFFNLFL